MGRPFRFFWGGFAGVGRRVEGQRQKPARFGAGFIFGSCHPEFAAGRYDNIAPLIAYSRPAFPEGMQAT